MGGLNFTYRRRRHVFNLLVATGLAAMPSVALAQRPLDGADAENDAATIVVTAAAARANERIEAAQRTVTSTSIIGADRLEQLGIGSTLDLMNVTPNLYQPRNTMSRSAAQYFIRGIGELDAQGEPSVGTFLDGVYVTRNLGAMQELLDIESIQVDRGPVIGVGHVVEGGAVRLFTLVPDNDLRVEAQAGYGSLNEWKAGFLVSGPLIRDRLYASFAIGHHQRDGTDDNVTLNRKVNTIDVTQARAKLRFTPNDRLDLTLSAYGTIDHSTNRGYGNFLNANQYDLIAPIYPRNHFEQFGVTGNTSYEFSDTLKLTSVTAYRGFSDDASYENTGDRFARNSSPLKYKDRAWSQDLYLKGTAGRLDFTIGAYGQYEYWRTDRNVNVSRTLFGIPNDTIIFTPVNAYIVQKNYNLSAYGEARYRLTDEIVLEAGLRLNWERHKTAQTLRYLVAGSNPSITVTDVSQVPAELDVLYGQPQGAVAWQIAANKNWTQLLPRIGISWEFNPDARAYASITQSTKSGGFDFRANGAATPSQATTPYDPERVTTYEVGLKTQPSSTVRFNGALFWNHFSNIQISAFDPFTALSRRFNAGVGHSAGVEGEAHVDVTPQWTLDATASYLYTRLDRYRGTYAQVLLANGDILPTAARSGAQLPNAPRFQGHASTRYTVPLGSAGSINLAGDISYQASTYLTAANSKYNRMPSQTYLNASIGWTSEDDRLSITVQARNLLDKRYLVWRGFSTTTGSPAHTTFDTAAFADPRTVFANVKWRL